MKMQSSFTMDILQNYTTPKVQKRLSKIGGGRKFIELEDQGVC